MAKAKKFIPCHIAGLSPKQAMQRRSFLTSLIAVVAAPLAPLLPMHKPSCEIRRMKCQGWSSVGYTRVTRHEAGHCVGIPDDAMREAVMQYIPPLTYQAGWHG